jgi:hypothetical protein
VVGKKPYPPGSEGRYDLWFAPGAANPRYAAAGFSRKEIKLAMSSVVFFTSCKCDSIVSAVQSASLVRVEQQLTKDNA